MDFKRVGEVLESKDRVYKINKIDLEFKNEPGVKYDVYICPHRLPSFLFVGCSLDPTVELYIEITELGDLCVYYATPKDYANMNCHNMKKTFVANIIFSNIYTHAINNVFSDLNPYISQLLCDSIDNTNYADRPGNVDPSGDPYIIAVEPTSDYK